MHISGIQKLFLLILVAQSPMHGMQFLKSVAGNARYYLMPASTNPVTWFNDNFYVVQEGACYRSKTVSPDALRKYIADFKIKTILNLREQSGVWFEKENALVDQMASVVLRSITLNGRALPSQADAATMLELFENKAVHPILIHCQAGADRTGLGAALWKLTQQNASLGEALAEQVASKGHFEWRFPLMKKFTHIIHRIKSNGCQTWQEAINQYNPEYEMQQISLPSLPTRAAQSLWSTIKDNPKAAALVAATAIGASAAIYAYKKNKLVPMMQSVQAKLFGK